MDKQTKGIFVLIGLLALLWFSSPIWLPFAVSILFPNPYPEQVKLRISVQDGLQDVVWTPAGASVIGFWQDEGEFKSNTFAESPDGTFTSTARILENTPVDILISDSGSGVWTRLIQVVVPNINCWGIDDPVAPGPTVLVYPHSATPKSDVAIHIQNTAGSTISNATNVAVGEDTWTVILSVADDKAWGNAYSNPQSKKAYIGGLFIVSADPTKFICYGYSWKVTYGSTAYYVWEVGQIRNDGDFSGDGSLTFAFSINALVAGADLIDCNLYSEVEYDSAHAANFGTTEVESADAMLDLHIA